MNALGKTLALVVGLALLGAMAFGAWLIFQTIVVLFAALDPEVATVTGLACLVALAAAWWIARGLRTAVNQSKAMALREEKTAAYQLFVDYWQSRLAGGTRADRAPAEAVGKLHLLDRLLSLYGGAAVIRAHTGLRDLDREGRAPRAELRARFGEALVVIRKDLGADTPRELAQELERLLLPASEVGGEGAAQTANPPVGAMP